MTVKTHICQMFFEARSILSTAAGIIHLSLLNAHRLIIKQKTGDVNNEQT